MSRTRRYPFLDTHLIYFYSTTMDSPDSTPVDSPVPFYATMADSSKSAPMASPISYSTITDSSESTPPATIYQLPVEILQEIAQYLPDRDFVNLSATSRGCTLSLDGFWRKRLLRAVETRPNIFLYACANGRTEVVQELVTTLGWDVKQGLATAYEKIHWPSESGNHHMLPHVRSTAPVEQFSSFCRCHEDFESGTCLIDLGQGDITRVPDREWRHYCQTNLFFPLHLAAAGGHIDVAQILLTNGARVDALAHVPGNTGTTEHDTREAVVEGIGRSHHTNTNGTRLPDAVVGKHLLSLVDAITELGSPLVNVIEKSDREILVNSSRTNVGGVETGAGNALVEFL